MTAGQARENGRLRIALAQLNFMVGDIAGNVHKIVAAADKARDKLNADVIVFPELAMSGYPPEDLLLRPAFHNNVLHGLAELRRRVSGIDAIVGYPSSEHGGLFNAASLLRKGRVCGTYHKQHLPNYSVFDEKRYFSAGSSPCLIDVKGIRAGITICEDVWTPEPVAQAAAAGASLVFNLNASPYHSGKDVEREAVVVQRAREMAVSIVYVNLVGGQDELVFDGGSFVVDSTGAIVHRARFFDEDLAVVEFPLDPIQRPLPATMSREESIYSALVLGVRDYVKKNRFPGVVIGLSGGIDSALTLAIAADAIGAENVEAVLLPSRYTASMSIEDAEAEARALGVAYQIIPIEPPFRAFQEVLRDELAAYPMDATEENIQARCRGVILMAISNKKRKMVLTTGNKSEMSVGYATLYGDMAGGFAPLKDVPKTMVWRLARYRNTLSHVIPERVIARPPSAELAPNQLDEDSLPPYDILDPILEMYIEKDMSPEEICKAGFDAGIVERVATMVNNNEYKRRQAPPGVRVTRRAFGRDRRYPISCSYTYD